MESYLTSTKRDSSIPAPIAGLPVYNRELGTPQVYDAGWFWRTPTRHIAHDLDVLACWDVSRGITVVDDDADVSSWTDRTGGYALTEGANHPRLDLDGGLHASRCLAFSQSASEKLSVTDTDLDDLDAYTYSAWIYWSGEPTADYAGIISKDGNTKRLEIDTSDGSLVGFHDTDGTDATSQSAASAISSSVWTHVAMRASAGWAREFYEVDGVRLGTYGCTPIGTNDLTVFGWIRMNSSASESRTILDSNLYAGIMLLHYPAGELRIYWSGGDDSYQSLRSFTAAPSGAWHFFCYTIDRDGTLTLYVDDMTTAEDSEGDISASDGEDWDADYLAIGNKESTSPRDGYPGRICGIGWCVGSVFTQAERQEVYNSGKRIAWGDISGATQSKITHYWEGNELSGPMLDKSGSADAYETTESNDFPFDGSSAKVGHAPAPGAPTLSLFVDGEEVTYATQTPGTGSSVSEAGDALVVGYSQAASDYFDGRIGEVIVDNDVYPDDVYRTLCNATKPQD